MKIHSESVIRHPREKVYLAYRDNLSALAAYIPDVKRIDVVSRDDVGDRVKLHNVWVGDREIPKVMQPFLKPDMLEWDDFADWDRATWSCAWNLRIRVFTENVTCRGVNTFAEVGAGATRLTLSGDLDIDLASMKGVPRLLAPTLKPQVEKFIVGLITPNLEKVNGALEKYLDAGR